MAQFAFEREYQSKQNYKVTAGTFAEIVARVRLSLTDEMIGGSDRTVRPIPELEQGILGGTNLAENPTVDKYFFNPIRRERP